MEEITTEELRDAFASLPDDIKQELHAETRVVDTVAVKMELIKFVNELHKHNQGVNWETNKQKPKDITVEYVIEGSQKLFEFLTK